LSLHGVHLPHVPVVDKSGAALFELSALRMPIAVPFELLLSGGGFGGGFGVGPSGALVHVDGTVKYTAVGQSISVGAHCACCAVGAV
jgi:hypothetical protein